MDAALLTVVITLLAAIAIWLISFAIHALRQSPEEPSSLWWAPDIPVRHAEIAGVRLRYIRHGSGPPLVLLHTLRTQLDLFAKLVPALSPAFTIYAFDYPGHGYSGIPHARYDAAFFAAAIEGFLDHLDLHEVTLAGISIGGVLPLIIAARHNVRVARVISINPYDYADGRGMARSSFFGWIATHAALVPFVGETMMRLTPFFVMHRILEGGVADPRNMRLAMARDMYRVGARQGHYRAFLSLLRNAKSWQAAQADYGRIAVPALLIWGDKDWSRPIERARTQGLIPEVAVHTIRGAGHFLSLDRPAELSAMIQKFAADAQ